jgi:hypothetical protein
VPGRVKAAAQAQTQKKEFAHAVKECPIETSLIDCPKQKREGPTP